MSRDGRAYMLASQRTDWQTPPELFDALDAEFGPFTLDPCGQREHHYTAFRCVQNGGHFYDGSTEAMDGLTQPWDGRVFMNPVYGRQIGRWLEKAFWETCVRGSAEIVVGLIPAKPDTRWWHNWVGLATVNGAESKMVAAEVRFLKGRLTFVGAPAGAPFPSAVVVWRR